MSAPRFARVPAEPLHVSARAEQVLAMLARHADREGRAWPSIARLAELCGCCRRTVERALGELVRAGVIERSTAPGMTSVYRLTYDTGVAGGATPMSQGGATLVSQGTRTRELSRAPARTRAREADRLGRLDRWLDQVGVHYAEDPPAFRDELLRLFAIGLDDPLQFVLLDRARSIAQARHLTVAS